MNAYPIFLSHTGRTSLYMHLGMTGCMLENVENVQCNAGVTNTTGFGVSNRIPHDYNHHYHNYRQQKEVYSYKHDHLPYYHHYHCLPQHPHHHYHSIIIIKIITSSQM
jgi:hypothetical protein